MIRVGITGGLGSGKSYVANIFKNKYDIPIYNSDIRAKYLMVNSDLKYEVIKNFGKDSYINGEINKEKFNKLLFSNKEALSLMNSIVYPFMEDDFNSFCKNLKSIYVIKESAILFETDDYKSLDKIICVVSNINLRLSRTIIRDRMTEDLFYKKVMNQSSDEFKIEMSDFVIYNNGEDLEKQIDVINERIDE